MRSHFKVVFILFFMILFILFSQTVRISVFNSLSLCAHILIPSLFPFFVISGMIIDFGGFKIIPPHISSFVIGILCGFPIGTKAVCRNYRDFLITREQAQALLTCTANASPAFVIIALGEAIFESKTIGLVLWLSQFLNALIMFLLFVPKGQKLSPQPDRPPSIIKSLVQTTKSSGEQMLFVCSITVTFGIICDLLQPFLGSESKKLLGLIEILHGSKLLKSNDLILASIILGFSGLCILTQCIHYVHETNLDSFFLILGKIHSSITMPMYLNIFLGTSVSHKITAIIIIILTNITSMCIIRCKGCDKQYDFFKKHRKMLRLLRTRD